MGLTSVVVSPRPPTLTFRFANIITCLAYAAWRSEEYEVILAGA